MTKIDRRAFIGSLAAASAGCTIVPRHVLGGKGYQAPSDMILLAQVGCGMQAQRQVNSGLAASKDLLFVAVVEPVFANLRHNKRLNRFTLRGRRKVNAQWTIYCLVHNIEKLMKDHLQTSYY